MQAVNPSSPVVPSHASSETLAIVIPCFNEAEALPQLAQRLPEVVDKLTTMGIVITGGSTDTARARVTAENEKWAGVIRRGNLKLTTD